MILDKTGTLTYGQPALSEELYAPSFTRDAVLPLVAAIERYSRHPIAGAIVDRGDQAGYALPDVAWIREEPGVGLHGQVGASTVLVTGRAHAATRFALPPSAANRARVRRRRERSVCGDLSISRRCPGGQPSVRRPSGSEARLLARAAGVRRSRARSAAAR